MITSSKEYNNLYYEFTDPNSSTRYSDLTYKVMDPEDPNYLSYVTIPKDEPIYKIDLNTRKIETPKFLSVLEDHNSEIIWFKVDRFYDDFDLYGSTCLIQYKNALKEEYVCVTIPKVIDDGNHDMLYIPWPVAGAATKAAGKIEFAFQFYKLSEDGTRVYYSLNTLPATSEILHGMHIDPLSLIEGESPEDSQFNPQYTELKNLMLQILEDYSNYHKEDIYWLEPK